MQGKPALVLLHEIYGVNAFMRRQCARFTAAGWQVVCPDLLHRPAFAYQQADEAYRFFMGTGGFARSAEVNALVTRLHGQCGKVVVVGYSVGATLAWQCCENPQCSGIVACYGSRIRQYAGLTPTCPSLLLFAENDSFVLPPVLAQLQGKPGVRLATFGAAHGFLDADNSAWQAQPAQSANLQIDRFLASIAH